MKFRPVGDKVLVEPIKDIGQRGALFIPEAHRDAPNEAVVVQLGTGATTKTGRTEFEVKIGDRVIIDRFQGQAVEISGKQYKIMERQDLLAIIE